MTARRGNARLPRAAGQADLVPGIRGRIRGRSSPASSAAGWAAVSIFTGKKIVAYHKNWIYLTELFGLEVIGYVEPKPGIPPSARHVHELIERIERDRGAGAAGGELLRRRQGSRRLPSEPTVVLSSYPWVRTSRDHGTTSSWSICGSTASHGPSGTDGSTADARRAQVPRRTLGGLPDPGDHPRLLRYPRAAPGGDLRRPGAGADRRDGRRRGLHLRSRAGQRPVVRLSRWAPRSSVRRSSA